MTSRADPGTYRFDLFQLDPMRGCVLGPGGSELRLRPKAFALLRHLLDNPGKLLSRNDLLDAVWPGTAVTDDSLTQCIGDLRQVFGDRGAQVLRTVPKRGYMLIAEVRRDDLPRPEPRLAPARDLAALRHVPLAVHDFEASDNDGACTALADALGTDLVAASTRLGGLHILPATAVIPAEAYHVNGEVRDLGQDLRVAIQLVDGRTGVVLWAHRLEVPRDHPPGLPEKMLETLGVHLAQQVEQHGLSLARDKPVDTLTARELCLVGRDHHGRGTEADTRIAREMFARAIAADPDYAPAYAWQAYTVHRVITHGWGDLEPQAAREESLRLAQRAVQIEPDAPLCLSRLAFSLLLHRRWEEALAAARAALASEKPALAPARITCCEVLAAAGYSEEAVAVAEDTISRLPLCPPTAHGILGRALLLAGQSEAALAPLRWCASHLPDYAPTYDSLMVAAVEAGRLDEARAARDELFRLQPGWVPRNHTSFWFFRHSSDVHRFQAAYRQLAGAAAGGEPVDAEGVSAPRAGRDPLPAVPRAPAPRLADTRTLADLRRETLVLHFSEAASDDPVTRRAASALATALVAELVRYEELNVTSLLGHEGRQGCGLKASVQCSGNEVHAAVQLGDLASGTVLWAKRLQWPLDRAADPPAAAMKALAAAVNVQVGRIGLRRAREKPADSHTARDLGLLGRELYQRGSEADTLAARNMFDRAAAIDPGYALALAWHSLTLTRAVEHGWDGPGRDAVARQAAALARNATELEPDSPFCLASLALSLGLLGHWGEAVSAARLALDSEGAAGEGTRISCGDVLAAGGHPEEAVEVLQRAITEDPHGSPATHAVLGRALLVWGRAAEAMDELRLCAARLPDYALCFRTMVVAAIEAGLFEDARAALRELGRLRPGWVQGAEPIVWNLCREDLAERWQRSFQMAMRLDAVAKGGALIEAPASRS